MDVEKTICYEKSFDDECPITDIKFVTDEQLENYSNYTIVDDFKFTVKEDLDNQYELTLVYSKNHTESPLTGFKIGTNPCKDPQRSDINRLGRYYPTELQKGSCYGKFFNSGDDLRYQKSGITLNQLDLMQTYKLTEMLTSQPSS